MRIKFFLSILLFLSFYKAKAQTEIQGKIIGENSESLNGATVIVSKDTTSAVLSYAISDKAGNFRIATNSNSDSLFLKISFIGYTSYQESIPNKDQQLKIQLSPSNESLKEVIVKSEILEQRGDTLSFSVAAFKGKEDRVIADVLKKIPGIEIMPNGQIEYQGKPIQKYYIEGLDLLEGRYNLANENLSAEAVSKVQILENHQPIKVLDSLEFSERASLNIKLKKDITVSGTAEVGGGFSPLLWKLKATPMLFTKKRQALITYQANNTGTDPARQLRDFSFNFSGSEFNINQDNWLSILKLSEPPFSEERWLDNNAHMGSVNFLTKTGKDYELKTNISYLNDTQLQAGSKQTRFFTPTDTIDILERTSNDLYFNQLKGKLTLEKNTDKNYFKDQLEFKGFWDSQRGKLLNSENPIYQRTETPFQAIRNDLMMLKPVGKQLITFNSNTGYKSNNQDLIVKPGQFEGILNGNLPYPEMTQRLNSEEFFTDNSAGFTKALGKFTISPKIGLAFQNQLLSSYLLKEDRFDDPGFINDLKLFNTEAYLKNSFRFESEDEIWNLRLSTPFKFKFIKTENEYSEQERLQRFLFEPNLYARKKLSANWETSISGGLNYDFGEISNIYTGYILTNYRNLQAFDAPISERFNQYYSYDLSFRNPLKQFFMQGNYRFSHSKNNLLFANFISENGAIILDAIERDNYSSSHTFSLKASKYFNSLNTTLKLNGRYSINNREQLLNNDFVDLQNKVFSSGISIDAEILSWLSANYNGNFSFYETAFENRDLQNVKNQQHLLNLFFFLGDAQYLELEGEYYQNSISENNENYFLNLGYQYTFEKQNIDLNISWNNILNTNEFINVSSSEFSFIQNSYQLRPSQVLASLKFSF